MIQPLKISKYTLGVGDRFAHQAAAQLQSLSSSRPNRA
jgi:hypothetical protein